jgi:NAD(P)-dependent dehydrogenase (short-subunit alcohol dehydrogenase family)
MQISGKTILVSGASSGLGGACVKQMIGLGARVIGIDRSPPSGQLTGFTNDQYWHGQSDVTDEQSVRDAIEQGTSRFGNLSGAIACAGVLHGERLLGRDGPASLEAFRRVVDINVCGTFNIVRLAAESMAKGEATQPDGERGVIVMTSSIAAFDGQIGQAAYAASKGAVGAMTLPLARELGRFGIRVVSIAPGVFETPMMQAASEKVRQPLLEDSVFPKRFGYPEEFAATVQQIFENPMLNGTVLRLDAGLRM